MPTPLFTALGGAVAAAAVLAATAVPGRAVTAVAVHQESEDRQARGKALTESRCTVCHGLSTVTTAGRSEALWKQSVEEMIGLGAELTDDEAAAVVAYLARNFPGRG